VTTAGAYGADAAGEAGDINRGGGIGCGVVAKLSVAVVPPAFDSTGVEERAGVTTGAYCTDAAGEAGDINRGGGIGCGVVAKLSAEVVPPAFDSTGVEERAGVTTSRSYLA